MLMFVNKVNISNYIAGEKIGTYMVCFWQQTTAPEVYNDSNLT